MVSLPPDTKRALARIGPEFSIWFQPIFDRSADAQVYAYEALIRGTDGESDATVFAQLHTSDHSRFGEIARRLALQLALLRGLTERLSLNILPQAISDPLFGLAATLQAAREAGFPEARLIFEIAGTSALEHAAPIRRALEHCRHQGALVALDGLESGNDSLNALIALGPDIVKLDVRVVRDVDTHRARHDFVKATVDACRKLEIVLIADGIETAREMAALQSLGIGFMQGFLLGKPFPGSEETIFRFPTTKRPVPGARQQDRN
jgi:EAL domain-containing protein (putative c-di-GMP-specific phosphodiesterase class I)